MGFISQPTLPAGSEWSAWVYSGTVAANYVNVRTAARIAPGYGSTYYIQANIQVQLNGRFGTEWRPYGVRTNVNGELSGVYEGQASSVYWGTVATLYYEESAAPGTIISFTAQWYTQIVQSGGIAVPEPLNIPVYVNVGGTVRLVERAYINVGGTIKECEVYLNVNGVIKKIG